jgi:hypothetical protein
MDLERRTHLLNIVSNAAAAHKQWVEHGDSTMVPEDEIYTRFQEIADQAKVIFRPRAEPLEQLFLAFAPYWQAFVSAQQTTADHTMLPSDEFWAAWEALSASGTAARMPKLKRIEPIKELKEQNVPDWQICKIYGFLDENGQPDHQKLAEEVETSGKHTGPNTGWVAPVNRELALKIRQMEIDNDALNRRRAAKVAAAVTPAKESIEQLVAGGVSATQIAGMKRISVEKVYEYCAEHGLPKPPYDYTQVLQAPAAHDPTGTPERRQAMENLGRDRSPQNVPPAHPLRDRPDLGQQDAAQQGPAGDGESDQVEDEPGEETVPSGVDLSDLPLEESTAIQEAVGYFNQGMDISEIATAMSTDANKVHGNKVRAYLSKAGIDLKPARAG